MTLPPSPPISSFCPSHLSLPSLSPFPSCPFHSVPPASPFLSLPRQGAGTGHSLLLLPLPPFCPSHFLLPLQSLPLAPPSLLPHPAPSTNSCASPSSPSPPLFHSCLFLPGPPLLPLPLPPVLQLHEVGIVGGGGGGQSWNIRAWMSSAEKSLLSHNTW